MDEQIKVALQEGMQVALKAYDAIYAKGFHDSFKFIFKTSRNYKLIYGENNQILYQVPDGKSVTMHDEISGASFTWKASRFLHESTNIQPVVSCFRLLVQEHFHALYPNQNLEDVIRQMMSDVFVEYTFPPSLIKTEFDKPVLEYWKTTDVYRRYIQPMDNPLLSSRPPNLFL